MEFTKFDVIMIVTMTMSIVTMSFVFPSLGLGGGDAAVKDDIPEFNVSKNVFNISGELPEEPGTPTTGKMEYNSSKDEIYSDNQIWLDGDTSNGTEMLLLLDTKGNDVGAWEFNDWDSGNAVSEENRTFNDSGTELNASIDGYDVTAEVTEVDDLGSGEYYLELEYRIKNQPTSDGGWLGRLPIIGTVYSTGEAVAGTLAWLGNVVLYGLVSTLDYALTALSLIISAMVFIISIFFWFSSQYLSIVNASSGWAAVFLTIPALLLFLEYAKMIMIGISLLPTT